MNFVWSILAPLGVMLGLLVVGVGPLIAVGAIWRRRVGGFRATPLTRDLRRPAGYSLSQRIDDLHGQLFELLAVLTALPSCAIAALMVRDKIEASANPGVEIATTVVMLALLVAFSSWRMWTLLTQRRNLVVGMQGEQFVGEELGLLMREGCHVFHDVEMPDGSNIDHVVVNPSGVYSVNTKTYGRIADRFTEARVTIDYEQEKMLFPDRAIPIPMGRLKKEASWLSRELSEAAGFAVNVEPMLALPGWFIERKGTSKGVYVFNPKSPSKLFINSRTTLDAERMERLAYQLDRMTRDVPRSYQRSGDWAK